MGGWSDAWGCNGEISSGALRAPQENVENDEGGLVMRHSQFINATPDGHYADSATIFSPKRASLQLESKIMQVRSGGNGALEGGWSDAA